MNSLIPWLAEALRTGHATDTGERIDLCPEYLETLGYYRHLDLLALDVNSEADWLATAPAYKGDAHISFQVGEDLHFVLPVSPDILDGAKYLLLTRGGEMVTAPSPLEEAVSALASQSPAAHFVRAH